MLFVIKAYMHVFVVESQWLRCLVMCQNSQVVFPNFKQMVQHVIPSLVAKTMEQYVILILDSCVTTITSFDLWMSKSRHEIYVINFINSLWVPHDVTMGLFEPTNTFRIAMATQVKDLLSLYNLFNKLITYVKVRATICPPLHKLSFQILVVVFQLL